jgi:hypothetical protein
VSLSEPERAAVVHPVHLEVALSETERAGTPEFEAVQQVIT